MTAKQWEIHAAKLSAASAIENLRQLARQEQSLQAAKTRRDKAQQREAEKDIQRLCAQLAQKWPHAFRAYLEAIGSPSADVLRHEWQLQRLKGADIGEGSSWLEELGLSRSPCDALGLLPPYSFALDLRFELARPYLSRDDDAFYIIDNPVRKDKVFKVPLVAPTSWKGSLRSAATRGLLTSFAALLPDTRPTDEAEREAVLPQLWEERVRRVMLFGNEKKNEADFLNRWLAPRLFPEPPQESEEKKRRWLKKQAEQLGTKFEAYLKQNCYRTEKIEGRQGRLFCFPTFFDQIGLEIINPHDRERRVGKNPIIFECVPAGATGSFCLLYIPYDFPGQVTPDEATLQAQVKDDLPLVAEAVHDTLAVYGFGAKTSSGFGTVDPGRVSGEVRVNLSAARVEDAVEPGDGPQTLVRPITDLDRLPDLAHQLAEQVGGGI